MITPASNDAGVALVTGAGGFIGRYCAYGLARAGWNVIGIGRGQLSETDQRSWGINRWIESDLSAFLSKKSVLGVDLVIHCAGSGSVAASIEKPLLDFYSTVQSTIALLDYLRTTAPSARLVYPSSAAVYGSSTGPIHEDMACRPMSPYGVHKALAEDACLRYASIFGLNISIVRLFSVYGPWLRKQLFWEACVKLQTGNAEFSGTGEEMRDWLHVSDAVSLLGFAGAHACPTVPIVNGGTGKGTEVRKAIRLLANGFEGANFEFSGDAREGDPRHIVADTECALRWGWRPVHPISDGIREYVSWFRGIQKCAV